MRAVLKAETVTRRTEILLTGVTPMPLDGASEVSFLPEKASVRVQNGQIEAVYLFGPMVSPEGRVMVGHNLSRHWGHEEIETAPAWVQTLFWEAPRGITSWRLDT